MEVHKFTASCCFKQVSGCLSHQLWFISLFLNGIFMKDATETPECIPLKYFSSSSPYLEQWKFSVWLLNLHSLTVFIAGGEGPITVILVLQEDCHAWNAAHRWKEHRVTVMSCCDIVMLLYYHAEREESLLCFHAALHYHAVMLLCFSGDPNLCRCYIYLVSAGGRYQNLMVSLEVTSRLQPYMLSLNNAW